MNSFAAVVDHNVLLQAVGRSGCGSEEAGEEVAWAVVARADVGCGAGVFGGLKNNQYGEW